MLAELFVQMPVQDIDMYDAGFPFEAVFGICVRFLSFVIVGVTLILSINKRKMQRDDMEATLKMEMIERGYSAEDIERTLAARMGPPRGGCGPRGGWKRAAEFQGGRH